MKHVKLFKDFLLSSSHKNIHLSEQLVDSMDYGLLNEGGAAGHMSHPFDDMNLTFGDFKHIITAGLSGKLNFEEDPTEKCLAGDSMITLKKHGKISIKEVVDNKYQDDILSIDETGNLVWLPIVDWFNNGFANEWLLIELEDGRTLTVTPNHRIFTEGGDVKAEYLNIGDELIIE